MIKSADGNGIVLACNHHFFTYHTDHSLVKGKRIHDVRFRAVGIAEKDLVFGRHEGVDLVALDGIVGNADETQIIALEGFAESGESRLELSSCHRVEVGALMIDHLIIGFSLSADIQLAVLVYGNAVFTHLIPCRGVRRTGTGGKGKKG